MPRFKACGILKMHIVFDLTALKFYFFDKVYRPFVKRLGNGFSFVLLCVKPLPANANLTWKLLGIKLLFFPFSFLIICLGKQQKMVQVLESLEPLGRPR